MFVSHVAPLHEYKRWNDECFLYCQNLVTEIKDNGKSFLSSLVDDVLQKIALSKNIIESLKLINVFIQRNEITPNNTALLKEIKALKPWVVVWSNLCDYFTRKDFIYMAKFISTTETMHSGHTMNWLQSVFGTEISDYPIALRQQKIDLLQKFIGSVTKMLCSSGIMKRMNPEFITNISNKLGYMFGLQFFEKWKEFYFQGVKCDKVTMSSPHTLSTSFEIYYFQFTFKDEMIMSKGLSEI